ncbi:MAG TPA: Plug domain-containing protein [Chthoniobacterales bacterium]|nr:Plug domain-containing protein [Chthoniobacterales bacterium]
MIKSAFAVVAGLMVFCFATPARTETDTIVREELDDSGATETGPALSLERPDLFNGVDSATLIHGLPVLTLLDGRRFPISDLGRMGMTPFEAFPVAFLSAVDVHRVGGLPRYGTDARAAW